MTWIEVADSAIKIGLGALIAGFITFLLSSIQHKNELAKAKVAREFEMLKEVAENIETFNRIALRYWAYVTHWRLKALPEGGLKSDNLINSQNDLFNSFSDLTKAESLLLLFGYKEASIAARNFGETVIAFKRHVEDLNTLFSDDNAAHHRQAMITDRSHLFDLLNEIYNKI